MSTPTEQITAQSGAFYYALANPEWRWGRHLIGPVQLENLFASERKSKRVEELEYKLRKIRKVAKRLAYALSFEAMAQGDFERHRKAVLAEYHEVKEL